MTASRLTQTLPALFWAVSADHIKPSGLCRTHLLRAVAAEGPGHPDAKPGGSSTSARRAPEQSVKADRSVRILLGEDNAADVGLVREALVHHGLDADIHLLQDGEALLRWIDRVEAGEMPLPDIVLLDLNMPRFGGLAVLERLRSSAICGHVPVIIVTSSGASSDRDAAARLGATSYFRKPLDFDEFLMLGALVKQLVARGGGIRD